MTTNNFMKNVDDVLKVCPKRVSNKNNNQTYNMP